MRPWGTSRDAHPASPSGRAPTRSNGVAPPGPDLASRARPRNAGRLVDVAAQLDAVFDAAAGKVVRADVGEPWLRPRAAEDHGQEPAAVLSRWLETFAGELELVWRARNNVRWGEWISDGNVEAAMRMAERLLDLARTAAARA